MKLSPSQEALVLKLQSNVSTGLTTDQATARREQQGFNVVKPPVDCPAWICCLLPCIKHVPSMKAFAAMRPEDAEILRNNKWIRYDASSLVPGDVIRLEEGDQVPADCVLLHIEEADGEILVDQRAVTGEDKPVSARVDATGHVPGLTLYWGGTVVQGAGTAIVTTTGAQTLVARLIREKRFPPTENVLLTSAITADEEGISLMSRRSTV